MPLITPSTYRPLLWARNSHLNTMAASKMRKLPVFHYFRERITTPDEDFLDLDYLFARKDSETAVIISHGLEGSSHSTYMRGIALAIQSRGWDAIAINMRGCSGEPNRLYSSYHSGKTDDLETVLYHVVQKKQYKNIILLGYSLGGNITLRYAGEKGSELPLEVKAVVGVSVPVELHSSARELTLKKNFIYQYRFLIDLKKKLYRKIREFSVVDVDIKRIHHLKTLQQFDDIYTAPAHGFTDAIDYYTQCSSLPVLEEIKVPSLLLNARDDSFISDQCYPEELARDQELFHLEAPDFGGHVGFLSKWPLAEQQWHESRILEFIQKMIF